MFARRSDPRGLRPLAVAHQVGSAVATLFSLDCCRQHSIPSFCPPASSSHLPLTHHLPRALTRRSRSVEEMRNQSSCGKDPFDTLFPDRLQPLSHLVCWKVLARRGANLANSLKIEGNRSAPDIYVLRLNIPAVASTTPFPPLGHRLFLASPSSSYSS